MNQPNLFELPPDGPSLMDRLRAFETQHGILIHHAKDLPEPFLALIPFREDRGRDVADICAKWCVDYDKAGRLAEAKTELQAVRDLCAKNGIHCPF